MKKVSILFALLLSCSLTTFSQGISQQLGADIDGEAANDWSGQSVSMNAAGDRLAIGAPLNGIGIAGHVRIYDWDGTAWMQLGNDIEGDSLDQSGHSVSMNSAGDRLAIGGIGGAGRTRIFEWNGTAWIQLGADIDGEAADDRSGYSVSMNDAGDRLAIGARFNDGGGLNGGHVRIYDWDGTAWIQVGTDIDAEASGDRCGHSVSMNATGDRLAIGAPGAAGKGRTRIFEWNGTAWIQLGAGIDGDEYNEDSGWSVSMNATGDRLAIGTPQGIGNDIGYVRIYDWDGTTWIQVGTDINGAGWSRSGHSVSMNAAGDRLAIGAPNASLGYIGHVRIYDWNGTAWAQYGADIDGEATYDYSGHSVSMNAAGDILAIGAWGNSNEAGHTRIYGECGNTGTDIQAACNTYEWIDGNTYTASNNTAQWTLTNADGCDSLVTLDLTVNYSTTGTDVQTACNTYDWIDGNTYTASNNTAQWTLANTAGCDSLVTLDLTVNYSTTGTDVQTACNTYDWIDGNTYTASNNTAQWTLANAACLLYTSPSPRDRQKTRMPSSA